jgi:AcrR family transcriptional regulator
MATSAPEPRRLTAKARVTRQRLIDAAADMFATRGFEQTSVRAIGDELGLTTGAVYNHFRSKADLLAAAVADGIGEQVDVEQPASSTYVDGAAELFRRYRSQAKLRALLLAAATAAKQDDDVRERLRAIQDERMAAWIAVAERDRALGEVDVEGVAVDTLVKLLWALEFGLVVFEVFGMELPDPEETAATVRHLLT